jgi:hypothetical protein
MLAMHPKHPSFLSAGFMLGTALLTPGAVHAQPDMAPAQPGAYPAQPGMAPAQPGAYPAQPGMAPAQPGAYPAQPGAYPTQPDMAPAPPDTNAPAELPGWAQSRVGIALTLLGPNSLIGGGLAYQPMRWVELQLWGGYNGASATGSTGVAYAEASISVITALARARIWPLQRHSVIIDTGLGMSHYSMSANGHGTYSSNAGDTIDYRLSGTPLVGNLGVGYGFRSNSVFRVAVIAGAIVHITKLGHGTVTTTGSFTESDRADMRADLDDAIAPLMRPRAYLDASFGLLF